MLTAKLEKAIVERLVKSLNPNRIMLFGSHAWGQPDKDSDVDILIILPDSDRINKKSKLFNAFQCLRGIGLPKDIILRTQAEFDKKSMVVSSLEFETLKHGRVIWTRQNGS